MIYHYDIQNNTLYLYCDFRQEIGKIEKICEEESFFDYIKNYIKKKKIPFTGGIIAIVVGSMIITKIHVTPELTLKEEASIPTTIEIVEKVTSKKEEERQEEQTNFLVEEKKEEVSQELKHEEDNINHSIYISIKDKNGNISTIELEEYVKGVVAAEMPASFHIEALKAQAVLARTYALKAKEKNKFLTTSNETQNYKTKEELQTLWGPSYDAYYQKIKTAVESTKKEYLSYEGNYIEAVYHSTSNGKTESSIYVWNTYYPYLISVDSPYDNTNPSYQKEQFFSYEELREKLNTEVNEETEFIPLKKTESSRIDEMEINELHFTGTSLRNLLGLRSTDFEIQKVENGVIIKTTGYGHGVGMSQYGANGMAKAGSTYQEILAHYYPNTTLSSLE